MAARCSPPSPASSSCASPSRRGRARPSRPPAAAPGNGNLTDQIVYFHLGPVAINATILFTWVVMLLLTAGSWLVTRRLRDTETMSRWQNLLEVLVEGMGDQIREVSQTEPGRYLPFVGTLFPRSSRARTSSASSRASGRRPARYRPPRPSPSASPPCRSTPSSRTRRRLSAPVSAADLLHAPVQHHRRALADAGLAVRLYGRTS
ncbi:MAG: hypothetical protein R3D25_15940 [Geminicoccaceae bacterium]